MKEFLIIKPRTEAEGYLFAAEEFQKLAREVTGYKAEIAGTDDGVSDLVVIGSDAVNPVAADLMLDCTIDSFTLRFGSDDFQIISYELDGRRLLFLAGGRVRSTIYAVYTYFEQVCGCRWFWDGDRIPKGDSLPMEGICITESPRFAYRGIRYFAHRGLHRFQAEHWDLEDWKREIRWMLKKKLNLFMLRIGTDDLFQKAFPDIVDYPPENGVANPGKTGYNERTSAWSLKYRGELRKQILDYAFGRDLMHPEDCGSITHWYSPTPKDFLEKVKPKTFAQSDDQYFGNAETLVWDVREKENFDNYMRLTETHVKEYGRPELFHTIGFAERMYSDDREKNMRMKQHIYNKTAEHIRREYPGSKLLIASWDLWFTYQPHEVRRLVSRLDKERTILFDYASDNITENNFTNWGVMGEFPYIIGIFHAFSRDADIRGNYPMTEKRIAKAAADAYCKGLIFWPELSHSDTFMLEYFAQNAWKPEEQSLNDRLEAYCRDRYSDNRAALTEVWKKFLPIAQLMSWCMDDSDKDNPMEYWLAPERVLRLAKDGKDYVKSFDLAALEKYRKDAVWILETLGRLSGCSGMEKRDSMDIARTLLGRYIHGAILAGVCAETPEGIEDGRKRTMALMEEMGRLLGTDPAYSMLATCKRMEQTAPVNPAFYNTIKENASCFYHRSYFAEQVKVLYMPELAVMFDWLARGKTDCEGCLEQLRQIHRRYLETPLEALTEHPRYGAEEVMQAAARKLAEWR